MAYMQVNIITLALIVSEQNLDSFGLLVELLTDNKSSFQEMRNMETLSPDYTLEDEVLLYKGKLYVNRHTSLCTRLIQEVHTQSSSAHCSGTKTYQLLASRYHWTGMGSDCRRYILNCMKCWHSHAGQSKQSGLLHLLLILEYSMQHLIIDFKDFPQDKHSYNCILVFIDRLSKTSVTIPCHKDIDSRGMAELFVKWIYRFGHTPDTIVSDRGSQFVSSFWNEFCRIIEIKIKLSTVYHKETDGQTEIMNKYIDQRLRSYVSFYQDNWSELLSIIDRAQLTLSHSSIGMSLYQVLYRREPKNSWDWKSPPLANVREKLNLEKARAVSERMKNAWLVAKENMKKAQARMLSSTNLHRRSLDWDVGDKVYLSTRNLKTYCFSRKLDDKWKEPYNVIEKVGFSYRLRLSLGSTMYDIFALELLSKDSNNSLPGQERPKLSTKIIDGQEEWEVKEIFVVRLVRKTLMYQISWVGHDLDLIWYSASNFINSSHKLKEFHDKYPDKKRPRMLSEWILT